MIGLFAGTFDPPTFGHQNLILRASKLCEKLFVALAANANKSNFLMTTEERMQALEELISGLPNVELVVVNGLLVEFAKKNNVDFFIRGLRGCHDLSYEQSLAQANLHLGNIETVFLCADANYAHISSTLIREIVLYGGSLKGFVPAYVEKILKAKN